MGARRALAALLAALAASSAVSTPSHAALQEVGFRAVGVAHAREPISAVAVAPDGRLFAAIQSLGQTSGETPGQAAIRVYTEYAHQDGSTMDEGTLWATLEGIRSTSAEEGVLGLALAPDFATSKLLFVYVTTTDESSNQHIRVYKENANGVGDFLGIVQTTLEPATGSQNRNGGGMTFGTDGCLYVGVGDSSGRWNGQLLTGTDTVGNTEANQLCNDVCLGASEFPERTIDHDGELNPSGKVLRFAVEGQSSAQPGPGYPQAAQPFLFSGGLRNPTAMGVHPLTGQLWVSERGDTQQAELDVLDDGSNAGWPCVEGGVIAASGVAGCLTGHPVDDVYAFHPAWRRPIASHTGNPVITGVAAYTGLSYPAAYYGDVFYLLRDSARIYRLDLEPPCFLPHPGGMTPVAFHDTNNDGDFTVRSYDFDDTGNQTDRAFPNLMVLFQGPDPLGMQSLYVVGRQGTATTDNSVVFRIEYATAYTPYAGPTGRVGDSCFTDGVYSGGSGAAPYAWENPFKRTTCLPPGGPCPGQPDGTACSDGDVCNGDEACLSGVCQHGTPAANGTACNDTSGCYGPGTCQDGFCVPGAALPDGSSCSDGDPCNGYETCVSGACTLTGNPESLAVKVLSVNRGAGTLSLTGTINSATPLTVDQDDAVGIRLADGGGVVLDVSLGHPARDAGWRRSRAPRQFTYQDRSGRNGGITTVKMKKRRGGTYSLTLKGRRMSLGGLDEASVTAHVTFADQCFVKGLACSGSPKVTCK